MKTPGNEKLMDRHHQAAGQEDRRPSVRPGPAASAGDDDVVAELPLAQLRVCGILHRGPRPMSALGRDLGVSLSAMTQIADRLERASLVKRVAEGNDRRVRCLRLTPRGESIMQRREDARAEHASAALARLSGEETEGSVRRLGDVAGRLPGQQGTQDTLTSGKGDCMRTIIATSGGVGDRGLRHGLCRALLYRRAGLPFPHGEGRPAAT